MTPETARQTAAAGPFPLRRPGTLAAAARFGARRYRRSRDLPGAVAGLLAGDPGAILPRLIQEERRCEEARRARSAEYRPAQHVQILSALLAEAAAGMGIAAGNCAQPAPTWPSASPESRCWNTTAAARNAANRASTPWRPRQAKASGSDALRLAT